MTCFETLELHPQTPADVAALARAEAHARGCEGCAARLAELRGADELLARGLSLWIAGSECPEPEALAEWIDAGRPRDEALESHLSGCEECRGDLLIGLADLAEQEQRSGGRAPLRVDWRQPAALLGAAALLFGLGLPLFLSGGAGGSNQVGVLPTAPPPLPTEQPAPRRAELPQPRRVEPSRPVEAAPAQPRHQPNVQPSDQPSWPRPEPSQEPSPAPSGEEPSQPDAQPSEEPSQPARPAPTHTPDPAPSPATSPAAGEPTPGPTRPQAPPPDPQPAPSAGPIVAAALSVAESEGLFVRLPEGRAFQAFSDGELPAGSELRAGPEGARVRLRQGQVFVQAQARLRWGEALEVERGQVLLEGRELRVRTAGGEVEVTGRALIEARRDQVGVQVLFGRARYQQGDQSQALESGQVLTGAAGRSPRVRSGGGQQGPAWVRPLRPLPPRGRRPGRRGGPNPGGTPRHNLPGPRR